MSDRLRKIPAFLDDRDNEGDVAVAEEWYPSNLTQPEGHPPAPQPNKAQAHWYQSALTGLIELSGLRPNWNSYGAVRPSNYFIQKMAEVLGTIARNFPNADAPNIFAVPSGGIALDWSSNSGEFNIKVKPGKRPFAWLECERGEPTQVDFDWNDHSTILPLAKQFFG